MSDHPTAAYGPAGPPSGPISVPVGAPPPSAQPWWQRWQLIVAALIGTGTILTAVGSLALGAGDARWERIEAARLAREALVERQAGRDVGQDRALGQAVDERRRQVAPLEATVRQLDERSRWTLILLQQLAAERRLGGGAQLPSPPPELLAPAPPAPAPGQP